MTVPSYLPYFVLVSGAGIVATLLFGLRLALSRAGWSADDQRRVVRMSALVLIGWLGVALALGGSGVYRGASDQIPTIQYGILVPILIGSATEKFYVVERRADGEERPGPPRAAKWFPTSYSFLAWSGRRGQRCRPD